MTQNNVEWARIGDFISICDETNSSNYDLNVIGINRDKEFMPTVANLESIDLRKYKVVRKNRFVFSGMQTGRDICIRISLYEQDTPALISPAYTTFEIKDFSKLLPEYLLIYFLRKEMDRYGWFISDSSVRANLDWSRFLDIKIPIPAIDVQKKVVNTWKHLREVKEQNEAIAEPLFQLCQSYIQELKNNLELNAVGEYLYYSDKRNDSGDYKLEDVKGISIDKVIIKTKANMDNVSLKPYKLFAHNEFCYVPVTSRNGDKITIAINPTNDTYIVSSSYEVFGVRDHQKLLPEYLYMWFCRSEFDRLARFNSWGSARETYQWEDLCRFQIPLPSLEVQKAIVNIFQCAKEAKHIAEEADKLSREICPALIQKVIHE